ncbi:hypothetical protein BC829DRAFT_393021 [Chytridium lagenaria]|nr:hypothetical protein BC829DRAFT_393021 [Chytridium lagenaria]
MFIYMQHNVTLDEPLVDAEGFPRSDVDVYTIRHMRHEMAVKRNDYKDLMKRMEIVMQGVFQRGGLQAKPQLQQKPFALVNTVAPRSPAFTAGLKPGDKILRFGPLSAENDGFKGLPQTVQNSEDQSLIVHVERDGHFVKIDLVPTRWEGNGLLGCHLVLPPN